MRSKYILKNGFCFYKAKPIVLFFSALLVAPVLGAKTLIFQSDNSSQPDRPSQTLVQSEVVQKANPSVETYSSPPVSNANAGNSELFFMLEQMQVEVRQLRGVVEEQANQIHHLKRDAKNRYQDLDARVLDLTKTVSSSSAAIVGVPLPVVPKIVPALVVPVDKGGAEGAQISVAPPTPYTKRDSAPPSEQQRQVYQQAYNLIKDKDFEGAVNKLQIFIDQYPNGELTGNAYYWLGEVYLVLPQLEQAKQAFSIVVSAFPDHRKAADALFKLAVSYDRLHDPEQSEKYLSEVQQKFPDSTAAKLAKNYKINR